MKPALVLLSDDDDDAPRLPAIATVSKSEAWDRGGWFLGVTAAQRGELWVDRPYWNGNVDINWLASICASITVAGGYCQAGNEQNLPLEGWQGGVSAWRAFWSGLNSRYPQGNWLAMPPSPGVPGWQEWVIREARRLAVHCYGTLSEMKAIVEWYLQNTSGDLFITECNFAPPRQVDRNAWAREHLKPFLDWCGTQARIKVVAYFAHFWDLSHTLPTPVDAKGTEILNVLKNWRPAAPPPPPPPPPPPGGNVLFEKLQQALGARYHDVRGTLEHSTDPANQFASVDSRQMPYIAIHHTDSARDTTAEAIARFHVRDRGWPGIGYHFLVRLGHVYYVGDVHTQRAHVAGRNDEALGIAVTGDYASAAIAADDLDALRILVRVLDEYYGHRKELQGHKQITPPGHTTCPERLMEAIPLLRQSPPARYTKEHVKKAAYYVEKLARDLKEGKIVEPAGGEGVHNALEAIALPALYAARDK